MLLNELKAKLDIYLGMEGEVVRDGNGTPRSVKYTSPTGIELMSVLISEKIDAGNNIHYIIGGVTGGLPTSWGTLMSMND